MSNEVIIDDSELTEYMHKIADSTSLRANVGRLISIDGENILKREAESVRTFGLLALSIDSEANDDEVSIFSRLVYAPFALAVGRGPGGFPSINALEKYVLKKGMADKKNSRSVAFLLARKIAREGTQRYRAGGPNLVEDAAKQIENTVLPTALSFILNFFD